jgi:hypothetical protein
MKRTVEDLPSWLAPADVARVLGVSKWWVYRHKHELPFTRLNDGDCAPLRMDPADLAAYMTRNS